MKGKKKPLLAILTSLAISVGAFGFIGCGDGGNSNDKNDGSGINTQIYAIYMLYADSAAQRGEDVMTYEEWYADLLENARGEQGPQGEKGETGEQGPQGEKGETGEQGVGIVDVKVEYFYDDIGNQWMRFTFLLSDGNTIIEEVMIPMYEPPVDPSTQYELIVPIREFNAIRWYDDFVWDDTMQWYRLHGGMDFAALAGTDVLAAVDGTVTSVTYDNSGYTVIKIAHVNDFTTVYKYVKPAKGLEVGQKVNRGQVIGTVAAASDRHDADGDRLHFEVHKNGERVDPSHYLNIFI